MSASPKKLLPCRGNHWINFLIFLMKYCLPSICYFIITLVIELIHFISFPHSVSYGFFLYILFKLCVRNDIIKDFMQAWHTSSAVVRTVVFCIHWFFIYFKWLGTSGSQVALCRIENSLESKWRLHLRNESRLLPLFCIGMHMILFQQPWVNWIFSVIFYNNPCQSVFPGR